MKKEGLKFRFIYNKKVLFAILILILILGGIVFLINKNNSKNPINKDNKCVADSDCVKDSCCHASSCVSINLKPDCSKAICTMSCESILDCGAGKCSCVENKCKAVAIN